MEGEILKGHLDMIVLAALAAGPAHGYGIIQEIKRRSGDVFDLPEGTIYPVLRALSAAGLLTSRVVPSYAGPPRRYYRITDEGRDVLKEWGRIWRQTRDFVNRFTEGTPP